MENDIEKNSVESEKNIDSSEDDIDDILRNIDNSESKINDKIKKELNNQNKQTNKKMDISSKDELNKHLQLKLDKLGNRLKILQFKYNSYKSWYDKFNIMIIIISSLLSIFEAFRNEIHDEINGNKSLEIFLNMVPIGISSFITCSAAIIKFKKYQDKMENMQFTREKVILSISKIKHIQEMLWFSTTDNFDSIKKKYLDDIYSFYNESNSELERHIKYSDHKKLLKINKE